MFNGIYHLGKSSLSDETKYSFTFTLFYRFNQNITQKVVTHIFLIILNPYFHILGLKVLGQMIAVKEILRNPKSLPSCK